MKCVKLSRLEYAPKLLLESYRVQHRTNSAPKMKYIIKACENIIFRMLQNFLAKIILMDTPLNVQTIIKPCISEVRGVSSVQLSSALLPPLCTILVILVSNSIS